MPLILTETDTVSNQPDIACTSQTLEYADERVATSGGTAGVTENTRSHPAVADTRVAVTYASVANEPNSTSWEAGNWVVRFEVTTANKNLTWDEADICRQNASLVHIANVGAVDALGIALGTTGVKSTTISGAAQTAGATDRIVVFGAFTNSTTMTQAIGIKPSQNIDTPVTQGGPGVSDHPVPPTVVRQAVQRAAVW